MSRRTRAAWIAFLTVALWLLFLPPANAYLDPGTGSYLFQLLVGAVLAVALSVKLFWRRVWAILFRRHVVPPGDPADPPSKRET